MRNSYPVSITTGRKVSLKSRATLPSLPHLPFSPLVTQDFLHLPRVFRYSIDRSSFLSPLMLPLWKLFKDDKKPAPFSPGQKYIRRDFSRFPIPFSYTDTLPSSDNIFEKVFFSLSSSLLSSCFVPSAQLDHERVSSRE